MYVYNCVYLAHETQLYNCSFIGLRVQLENVFSNNYVKNTFPILFLFNYSLNLTTTYNWTSVK